MHYRLDGPTTTLFTKQGCFTISCVLGPDTRYEICRTIFDSDKPKSIQYAKGNILRILSLLKKDLEKA